MEGAEELDEFSLLALVEATNNNSEHTLGCLFREEDAYSLVSRRGSPIFIVENGRNVHYKIRVPNIFIYLRSSHGAPPQTSFFGVAGQGMSPPGWLSSSQGTRPDSLQ